MQVNLPVKSTAKLSDLFALPHNLMILIPSTVNANEVASQDFITSVIKAVAIELSNRFGGGRALPVEEGFWVSDQYGLIIEPVTPVICSFADFNDENESFIVELAKWVKNTMSQESVFLLVDGKAYLV